MTRARDIADFVSVSARLDTVGGSEGALINRNLIINGEFTIAQRSGGTVTTSDGSNEGYSTVDRFELRYNSTAGGAIQISQSTDTPDGFGNSVKLKCSTADSAHTGTQAIYLGQRIEAQNLQQLRYGSLEPNK